MVPDQFLKEFETTLQGVFRKLEDELRAVRSNRPSVALVENIKVNYYDENLPVKQLGSLAVRPPKDIEIQVWDKNAVGPIQKAIEAANVGVSVAAEGNVVRASLPPLTEERRAELAKLVKKITEEGRIRVRHRRDDAIKKVKAAEDEKKISEDAAFRAKERIQKSVDEVNKRVDSLLEGKLKELQE